MVGLPSIQKKLLNLASRECLLCHSIHGDDFDSMEFLYSMGAVGPTSDPGVAADFPWDSIAKGKDGIVDVGGGQGTLCCSLATK
jgi:hypothetical protein